MTSEQRAAIERLREDVETLINAISRNLKRWETWFPNEMAEVDVPRRWLLAMKHYAEIALAEHQADDAEPVTEEWLRSVGFACPTKGMFPEKCPFIFAKSVTDEGVCIDYCWVGERIGQFGLTTDPGEGSTSFDIPNPKTRGDVRRLCTALGIELKEST